MPRTRGDLWLSCESARIELEIYSGHGAEPGKLRVPFYRLVALRTPRHGAGVETLVSQ